MDTSPKQPKAEKISENIRIQNGGTRPGAGRPKGQPNKVAAEIKVIAQAYGPAAIAAAARLAGLVSDENGKVDGMAESEQARLSALGIILDRAYGKAPQAIVGDPDNPIHHEIQARVVNIMAVETKH